MRVVRVDGFDEWRLAARALLADEVPPDRVRFVSPTDAPGLFDAAATPPADPPSIATVPRRFLEVAPLLVAFDGADALAFPYGVLWRLTHGERHLLDDPADPDAAEVRRRVTAVRHDVHRMHAFVRFRPVPEPHGGERMVAWHRPDHDVLALAVPHFVDRFGALRWAILTPRGSVSHDEGVLRPGPPVSEHERPASDGLEELWLAYYAAVFEPSRASATRLDHHLPARFRANLPEARLIPSLLSSAAARVDRARATQLPTAAFLPEDRSLPSLRAAALGCRACGLCEHATQTVFGEGDSSAALVLVGEQPGDQEDRQGHPFVGPAGRVLADAMAEIGIARDRVWLTNAVKHFKFTLGGSPAGEDPPERSRRGLKIDKPRLHRRPDPPEIEVCRPWLLAELAAIRPRVVVALGATAALSVLGRRVPVGDARNQPFRVRTGDHDARVVVTYHPSAVLRSGDARVLAALRADLALAARESGLLAE